MGRVTSMNRLIDAFEGLFTAASGCGGEVAETAKFTLENVNWRGRLSKPEPMSHPIVDRHLEAACALSRVSAGRFPLWIGIWKRPALTRDSTGQAPIGSLKPCWR